MSFTSTIKSEIVKYDLEKSEAFSFLAGFIRNNGVINNKLIINSENIKIIECIISLIKKYFDIKYEVNIISNLNFNKKKIIEISIYDYKNLLISIGYFNSYYEYLSVVPNYIIDDDILIKYYLKGVFIATGSINDPKSARYHMELSINKADEAVFIQALLNKYDLNAKILSRGKGYMIYIKESEKISDFLKIIEANNAVLYYENIRILKDKINNTNRLNNCEQANIDKIVQTSQDLLLDIKLIEESGNLNLLDDKELDVIKYRKKYPDKSLKELAIVISKNCDYNITKSGVNHRIRKIREFALKIKNCGDKL